MDKKIMLAVIVVVCVAGVGALFLVSRESQPLITKDPTEMVLVLEDLPSGFVPYGSWSYYTTSQEMAVWNLPESTVWEDWGFELYFGVAYDHPDYGLVINSATLFSNIEGAKARLNYIKENWAEYLVYEMKTIGDESIFVEYATYFRIKNVVAFIALAYNENFSSELEIIIDWAEIVENRILS